jgi:hypothetical protein
VHLVGLAHICHDARFSECTVYSFIEVLLAVSVKKQADIWI